MFNVVPKLSLASFYHLHIDVYTVLKYMEINGSLEDRKSILKKHMESFKKPIKHYKITSVFL